MAVDADILDFARGNAIALDENLACPDALFRLLDTALSDKRFLLVGEADHFIAEKTACRLLLAEAAPAFNCFGEELGTSDGARIREYLASGDETLLDEVSIYGYRGHERRDRDDRPTGILRAAQERFPEAAFAADHRHLLDGLRLRFDRTLDYFGFDIDAATGSAYARMIDLARHTPHIRGLARVSGESIDEELARLTATRHSIEDEATLAGAVDCLLEALRYIRAANPAPDYAALNPGHGHARAVHAA